MFPWGEEANYSSWLCYAGGQILPPTVIWNRKKIPPELTNEGFPGTIYGLSSKGWMDQKLLDHWF